MKLEIEPLMHRVNRQTLAAEQLAIRSKLYAQEAAAAGRGYWLPWALRSIRAGKASERFLRMARETMNAAMRGKVLC